MNATALHDDPTTIARDRAAAGARLLDAKRPEWFREINLDDLEMVDTCFCVIGQISRDYSKGLNELGVLALDDRIVHGFDTPYGDNVTYEDLDEAWRREIITRRYPEGHPED